MNRLLLGGHLQQVNSRNSEITITFITLQLHIEESNVFHILFTNINSQSKHIHRMYNESIVCLTSTISFAMHLIISSYVHDENTIQYDMI